MRFDRITIDPTVATGKPCIRHLRFPVSRLLGLLAAGETRESILKAYRYLESADIDGFRNERPVSERWRTLARGKIVELDALAGRIAIMRGLLQRIQRCQCLDVHRCGWRILNAHNNLRS